ncbi:MAG: helicase-exonuclease AddAB subunit AddB [Firmicutes bacterium]|nr:helicase-exonuclease AddAB subunit AddB [Bacillota bacterium]
MGLQLVLGRAGTGKTELCLDQIVKSVEQSPTGPPLILLVPEQATFQMERALLEALNRPAVIRAQVLSFHRLAWRILQQSGGAARPPLSELGKRMILWKLIQAHREELAIFGRLGRHGGFIEGLSRTITEMRSYRIDPQGLIGRTENDALSRKLQDLAMILERYDAHLQDRFTDPDAYLTAAASRLPGAGLEGCLLWVDGFAGFTPQELEMLGRLFLIAKEATVTLCLDSREVGKEDSPFRSTAETYIQLLRLAAERQVKIHPPIELAGQKRLRAPELAHLEREYPKRAGRTWDGPCPGVTLVRAPHPMGEVEGAAREIRRLVLDEGFRFREIAVILRDIDPYAPLIRAAFQDYQIPYFLDQRRAVACHPLVELVRSAVELVLSNWSYETIFRLLKTDLFPLSREEADRLENYALAYGIAGSQWIRGPWTYGPPGELEEINALRQKVAHILQPFAQQLSKAEKAGEMTAALYELLETLDVPLQLKGWADEDRGGVHDQIWQGVIDLFDQLIEGLGNQAMSIRDYLGVLETGLESLKVGLIPPGLDQVLIGAIDRSRHPEIRAAFILGAYEGSFPGVPREDLIFNDREREQLAAAGVELAPDSRRLLLWEEYLAYIALTRPSERLWISYPMTNAEGKPNVPSTLLTRTAKLLPGARKKELEPYWSEDNIRRAAGDLVLGLARGDEEAQKQLDQVLADEDLARRAGPILASLTYRVKDELSPGVGKKLYGDSLDLSVSRLEAFAACPFQHFAAHGLRLRPREEYDLDVRHIGSFLHEAMKLIGDRLMDLGPSWYEDLDQAVAIVDEICQEQGPRLLQGILSKTSRYRYLHQTLKRILLRVMEVLAEHARRGRFIPVGLEVDFGPRGSLPPLDLGGVRLRGRIDRIDAAAGPDGYYLRVVDYKSSVDGLSIEEVYYGLELQLLAYLLVALHNADRLLGGPARAAGALYFPLKDPFVSVDGPITDEESLGRERRKKLRMEGILLADPAALALMDCQIRGNNSELVPARVNKDGTVGKNKSCLPERRIQLLLAYAEKRMKVLSGEIAGGRAAVAPYRLRRKTACTYCDYKPLCGFDPLIPGCSFRHLPQLGDDEAWLRIAEEVGGDVDGAAASRD